MKKTIFSSFILLILLTTLTQANIYSENYYKYFEKTDYVLIEKNNYNHQIKPHYFYKFNYKDKTYISKDTTLHYYNYYSPTFQTYTKKECYYNPPPKKLFYIKCP